MRNFTQGDTGVLKTSINQTNKIQEEVVCISMKNWK